MRGFPAVGRQCTLKGMRYELMAIALVGAVFTGCNGKSSDQSCADGCGGAPSGDRGGSGGGADLGGSNGGANAAGSGGTIAAGSGGMGGAGGSPFNCGAVTYAATFLAADILILLDRSGSMANDVNDLPCMTTDPTTGATSRDCGLSSKWALTTPVIAQTATANEASVSWGLKYFADPGSSTCSVSASVQVPPALNNAAAITAAIAAETNANGSVTSSSRTPTRLAVQAAAAYLTGRTDPNPKYILLATDGLPNCEPGTSGTNDDSAGAIAAIQDAAAAGIGTFVVGIATAGQGTADATLSQMAVAGGFPPSYYPVSTATELTSAFETLVSVSKQPCTLSLPAPPTQDGTTSLSRIHVFADGVPLARDTTHADGWDYTDAAFTRIMVSGATCAGLQNGTVHAITIGFDCLLF
jgi:hypothetical protein